LKDALIEAGLAPSDSAAALEKALDMLATFIHLFAQNDLTTSTMQSLIENLGPLVIAAVLKLEEIKDRGLQDSRYAFPSSTGCTGGSNLLQGLPPPPTIHDPVLCLAWYLNILNNKNVRDLDTLVAYLVAMAYTASGSDASMREVGLEGIARATIMIEQVFPQLLNNGWFSLEVGILLDEINFNGVKRITDAPGYGALYDYLSVVGFIEPYLKTDVTCPLELVHGEV